MEIDFSDVLGDRKFEVTSRAKTIDTLRDKLRRDRATPLPSVQDIAGVRFEAEMSLREQDEVAARIARRFDHSDSCIHDLRAAPHSGYRAVHLWLRLPARVEVQIRTHLQGEWANAYEAAADQLGREIRYEGMPSDATAQDVVRGLRALSIEHIAALEADRDALDQLLTENQEILRNRDEFSIEDTLPADLARAIELGVRIDEMRERTRVREKRMRESLADLRRIFNDTGRRG